MYTFNVDNYHSNFIRDSMNQQIREKIEITLPSVSSRRFQVPYSLRLTLEKSTLGTRICIINLVDKTKLSCKTSTDAVT